MNHFVFVLSLLVLASTTTAQSSVGGNSVFTEQSVDYGWPGSDVTVEHTFQPDGTIGKDASINTLVPGANMGNGINLAVGYYYYGGFQHFHSLIQFTELDDPAYENATVVSADLQLYKYSTIIGFFTLGILTDDWIESEVTWNNRPSFTGYQPVHCPVGVEWFTIDVTGQVQDWLDGSVENYGFLLHDVDTALYDIFEFYSSDFDSVPGLCPRLVLNYIPYTAMDRASWAEIKTCF